MDCRGFGRHARGEQSPDRFAARLVGAVNRLRVGDGLAAGTTIGPLINAAAVAKVRGHVQDALARGARLLTPTATDAGRFVAPLVLGEADTGMRLASEETFGPVAPLFRFGSEDEALAIANRTSYGLAA